MIKLIDKCKSLWNSATEKLANSANARQLFILGLQSPITATIAYVSIRIARAAQRAAHKNESKMVRISPTHLGDMYRASLLEDWQEKDPDIVVTKVLETEKSVYDHENVIDITDDTP